LIVHSKNLITYPNLILHFIVISNKITLEVKSFPSIIMPSRGMLRRLISTKNQFARLDDRLDARVNQQRHPRTE